jgi:hypothetical protein
MPALALAPLYCPRGPETARLFFRRGCKIGPQGLYTQNRRELLGAFDLAKPRPADTGKGMDFDADFT